MIVNEDRLLNTTSGFTAYSRKEVILGTQWWRYIALSLRVRGATVVFGENFDANRFKVLYRLAQ